MKDKMYADVSNIQLQHKYSLSPKVRARSFIEASIDYSASYRNGTPAQLAIKLAGIDIEHLFATKEMTLLLTNVLLYFLHSKHYLRQGARTGRNNIFALKHYYLFYHI